MSATDRDQSSLVDDHKQADGSSHKVDDGNTESVDENKKQEETGDKKSESEPAADATTGNPWQAIWSAEYNAYYFYNPSTNETTWTNPLQPPQQDQDKDQKPAADGETAEQTPYTPAQAAAIAQGIDPSLAFLDPTLAQAGPSTVGGAPGVGPAFSAKFNARTGAFTAMTGRDPTHLSEFERAKRMSEFYFDVNAWEQDIDKRYHQGTAAEEEEPNSKKRKRPSKKDLERFKEQKKQKKIAKTAWLRT